MAGRAGAHAPIGQAGPEAAGPRTGGTTAPERTPVQDGQGRRRPPEAERISPEMRVMGREVVVAVTNGRLDGSAELAESLGPGSGSFASRNG